jgi:hypothetical protein
MTKCCDSFVCARKTFLMAMSQSFDAARHAALCAGQAAIWHALAQYKGLSHSKMRKNSCEKPQKTAPIILLGCSAARLHKGGSVLPREPQKNAPLLKPVRFPSPKISLAKVSLPRKKIARRRIHSLPPLLMIMRACCQVWPTTYFTYLVPPRLYGSLQPLRQPPDNAFARRACPPN